MREKQVDSEYHLHKIFPSIYLYKPVEGIDSKSFVITHENKHAEKSRLTTCQPFFLDQIPIPNLIS